MSTRLRDIKYTSLIPWVVFALTLTVYWLTVEPAASWWDCPEYLAGALLLEVGHPPGNPMWILTHRVLSAFAGGVHAQVIAVNMAAGLFTALASMLLSSVTMTVLRRVLWGMGRKRPERLAVCTGGLVAGLAFGWSDSAWYSAVEAEVYAMSIFMTALSVWIMAKWYFTISAKRRMQWLVLFGYVTGLSVGVHQLNLLCLPAMALVYGMRRSRGLKWNQSAFWLLAGCAAVAMVLMCMMPSALLIAMQFDLTAVNAFGLPYNTGTVAYAMVTLGLCFLLPVTACRRSLWVTIPLMAACLWLTGLTVPDHRLLAGIGAAIAVSLWVCLRLRKNRAALETLCWVIPMLFLGYCSYGLLMLRAASDPPMNQGNPSDPDALYTYVTREQYGGAPLLYGRTPWSRPMLKEKAETKENSHGGTDTVWRYAQYARKTRGGRYQKVTSGAKVSPHTGLLSSGQIREADSLSALSGISDRYILTDMRYDLTYTPELDMWFPRIWSGDQSDLKAYSSWVGADTCSMQRMRVSEAFDTAGRAVAKRDKAGHPVGRIAWRPTYMQAFRMMCQYQFGYMYGRYLMWNFSGRQNDVSSTGEADHGNFITGMPFIDNAMLGDQRLMPDDLSARNPGHHEYWLVPLVLGLWGAIWLQRQGQRGRRADGAALTLFLMTGIAIVFYLNQAPGEPRERDYSFLGSFWTYAFWIGCGAAGVLASVPQKGGLRPVRWCMGALLAAVPCIMAADNWADHDRSGRYAVEDFASNILLPLERDAIIAVHGDNIIFPLWFAQHVLGIRPDVTIVNTSYLGQPWYIRQLMMDTPGAPGLKMTMKPSDIAYGRYMYVMVPQDSDTADPQEAVSALHALYASDKSLPALSHGRLLLPSRFATEEGDRAVLDLRAKTTGQTDKWLSRAQLAMIDIAVTNASQSRPRPLYWHQTVSYTEYAGLYPHTVRTFGSRKYSPSTGVDYLHDLPADSLLGMLKWGGLETPGHYYTDETTGRHITQWRIALLLEALAREQQGDIDGAGKVALASVRGLPLERYPYRVHLTADSLVNCARDLASLLQRLADHPLMEGRAAADTFRHEALRILHADSVRHLQYSGYLKSLPPQLRHAVSPTTRSAAAR